MTDKRKTKQQLINELDDLRRQMESEEKYKSIVENSPDIIYTADPKGILLTINAAVTTILGYNPEELIGRNFLDFIPQGSMAPIIEDHNQIIGGKKVVGETVIVSKDGKERYLTFTTTPVMKDGSVIETRGVIRDITDQKKAEEKMRRMIEAASEGIVVIDLEGIIVELNDKKLEMHGYDSRDELLGKSAFELVAPYEHEKMAENMQRIKELGTIRDVEYTLLRKDGSEFYSEASAGVLRDALGRPEGFITIIRDITDKKRAEENYRQLLEDMNDGYAVIQGGNIVFANRKFGDIFGVDSEWMLGKSITELMLPEERHEIIDLFEKVLKGEVKNPDRYEAESIRRGDGERIVVESSTKPIQYENGPAFSVIMRDVTKRKRTEEKLMEAQKYTSNLIERSLDMIISVDRERRIVEFNRAAQKTFGYSKEEVLGRHVSMLYTDPEAGIKALESVKRTDRFIGEVINKKKNGETFVSFLAASALLNEKGEFIGTMGVSRDITERKLMEESIKYRLKVEEAIAGVSRLFTTQYDVDLDEVLRIVGEVVLANRVNIFLFHHGGKKMDNIREWCSTGTESQIRNLQNLDCSQFPWWMMKLKSGENIVINDVDSLSDEAAHEKQAFQSNNIRSLLVVPIYIKNDILAGFMGFDDTENCRQWSGEDASLLRVVSEMLANYWERRRTEDILRDSEEKLRLIFESVPEGIVVCDLRGAIVDLNSGAIHMLGYGNKQELIGNKGLELIAYSDHIRAGEDIRKTLETGSIGVSQYTFRRKDGSEFPATWSAAVLRDPGGQPAGFVFIAMDTTEQQKMQEQLMLADRLASIGQLTSGIAHELNNPLTSVIGFSELLLEREFPEDVREDLETIDREAKRAADVIKGLLTFVRKQGTEKSSIDINGIIREVLQLRSYEQKVSKIKVESSLFPDLPRVMGNGAQMQQVFINLIVNAEQSMRDAHGQGRLKVTTEKFGDMIRISIEDDGPGISPEDMKSLFTPFFTTKEVGKGTGLGLSICHGIVVEHGGRIFAESEPGAGAIFVVDLPVSKSAGKV